MKIIFWRNFIVYFIFTLTIAFFVGDTDGQLKLSSTILDIVNQSLVADSHNFAQTAIEVFKNGWFTESNMWVIHLWPPGFILLETAILKLFGGLSTPIIIILIILSSLSFAFALSMICDYISPLIGNLLGFIVPLIFFIFPFIRFFMLEPSGIIFGETLAISFFIISIILILQAVKEQKLNKAIYSGILFALSAYFRSQFELLVLSFSILSIPLFIYQLLIWKKNKSSNGSVSQLFTIKAVILMLLVTHLLMLPWRIYHQIEGKNFAWVQTSKLVVINSLASSKSLLKHNGNWIIAGGGNLACQLEPTYCDKTEKSLFYKAFAYNIVRWYELKAKKIKDFWYMPLVQTQHSNQINFVPNLFDFVSNTFFLILLISIFPLIIKLRKFPNSKMFLWIATSFFGTYFVIFTFVQFETRYFFLPKIFTLLFFIILLCNYIYQKKIIGDVNSND
jgi:hypothetical protein